MKLLMAHWTHRWGGGAQVVMIELARHFRQQGHRVDFVTTVGPGPAFQDFKTYCDESWHFGRSNFDPPASYLNRFRDSIDTRGYDALMVHHSLQAVAVAGLLPTRVATLSVIHEHPVHGSGFIGLENPGAFDAYVGVSDGVAKAARQALGDTRRVVTILNGVESGNSPERRQGQNFRMLFVGRLVEAQKGILLLPSIVRAARDRGIPVQLAVVGEGEDCARLEEAIRRNGVSESVALLGGLTHGEVFAQMERSEVLLLCSRHEGLALVLAEAMMRGCVPIATHLDESTAEIVTSGHDGLLVRHRTAEEFADAIEQLWRDRRLLERMRANAARTANDRFSLDRMLGEYDALVRELLMLPAVRPRNHKASLVRQI